MRAGLARAEEALAIADGYAAAVRHDARLFAAVRLSAVNQKVKCRMGLALVKAVKLLKYPRPGDLEMRLEAAAELRSAARGWEELREETHRVLLPGTFPESLECALRCKLDPAAAGSLVSFAGLLDAGKTLHGLLDGITW